MGTTSIGKKMGIVKKGIEKSTVSEKGGYWKQKKGIRKKCIEKKCKKKELKKKK